MLNLEIGKMSLDNQNWTPIDRWEVWFMTPMGVVNNLAGAVNLCKRADFDPEMTIIPVTVAISSNNDVEIVRR